MAGFWKFMRRPKAIAGSALLLFDRIVQFADWVARKEWLSGKLHEWFPSGIRAAFPLAAPVIGFLTDTPFGSTLVIGAALFLIWLASRSEHLGVRDDIAMFITECTGLRKRCFMRGDVDDPPSRDEIDQWITKVANYLSARTEASYAERFANPPPDRAVGLYKNASRDGNDKLRVLDNHLTMLHVIAGELKD